MVELGTKIIGNFGAMIPLSFGEVVTIESFEVGPREKEVKVVWDNGSYTWLMESEINAAVGKLSPIGYYTEEVYYENPDISLSPSIIALEQISRETLS